MFIASSKIKFKYVLILIPVFIQASLILSQAASEIAMLVLLAESALYVPSFLQSSNCFSTGTSQIFPLDISHLIKKSQNVPDAASFQILEYFLIQRLFSVLRKTAL